MSARTESLRLLPWLVVGFGFLVLALSYSGRATLGLVMPAVEQDMGWTRTFLSGSAAASLIVMAVLAPLAGWLVDRHGPRILAVAAPGRVGGNGEKAPVEASEEGGDEFEIRREEQESRVPR